jgi:hypothetical protein
MKSAPVANAEMAEGSLAEKYFQEQSPLFRLPKELRDAIFMFVMSADVKITEYESRVFRCCLERRTSYHSRSALHSTCRRAWIEWSRALKLETTNHASSGDDELRPNRRESLEQRRCQIREYALIFTALG